MLLRLINNPIEDEEVILPIDLHIHQRLEEIVYKKHIAESSVPLAYLDSQSIEANTNLSILDRSDSIPGNSIKKVFIPNDYHVINTSSYTSSYPDILITDVSVSDSRGNQQPLFWAHTLPSSTTIVKIERVTNTSSVILESGFVVDETKTRVYFNFTNTYNVLNGQYVLYYITTTTASGQVIKGLINPTSAVREATWEDLDPDTGLLNEDLVLYTKEETSSGFTYYFNKSKIFYVYVLPTSMISPIKFNQNLSSDGWFPRFTTGSFTNTDASGVTHNYYLPEYENIAFFPSRPYFFDSYSPYQSISKKVIYIGRTNTAINTTTRPLDIIISRTDGTVLYAFTTKTTKSGTRYNSTINWSSDEIASWDNSTGIVELNIAIQYDWELANSYYYEVKEFVYIYTNLNPIYNDLVYNHYYVYYIKPDQSTRALHHLIVRNDGIIVECSDDERALLVEGVYNPDTWVGLLYRESESGYSTPDWMSLYSTENTNAYQYLILAEIFFSERKNPSQIEVLDVARKGDALAQTNYSTAVHRNPKLFHSKYAATENGLEYSQNSVIVVRCSYSLLEEYGGDFTFEELETNFYKFLAAGNKIVFEWDEEVRDFSVSNYVTDQLFLSWSTVGPGFCYDIYRSSSIDSEFQLITTLCTDYSVASYIDTLTSAGVYYYYIVPTKDNIEYPSSYTIGIESR